MAIVGVPGWIGSSAVNETGQRWMSAAGAAVRRPAPFYMSQLANQSKFNFQFICAVPGTWAGVDVGYGGSITLNATGHQISTFSAHNRNTGGFDRPLLLACSNHGLGGFNVTVEGYGSMQCVWTGVTGNNGYRMYVAQGQEPLYHWLAARNGQTINVIAIAY